MGIEMCERQITCDRWNESISPIFLLKQVKLQSRGKAWSWLWECWKCKIGVLQLSVGVLVGRQRKTKCTVSFINPDWCWKFLPVPVVCCRCWRWDKELRPCTTDNRHPALDARFPFNGLCSPIGQHCGWSPPLFVSMCVWTEPTSIHRSITAVSRTWETCCLWRILNNRAVNGDLLWTFFLFYFYSQRPRNSVAVNSTPTDPRSASCYMHKHPHCTVPAEE